MPFGAVEMTIATSVSPYLFCTLISSCAVGYGRLCIRWIMMSDAVAVERSAKSHVGWLEGSI